jgi:flagellar secretion chaperone FliS
MTDPVRMYRESAVRGATPVGLIVILYEEVIRSLRRGQHSIEQNEIEQRTGGLNQAIRIIGHLQAMLNFDAGGEVARNLSHFYNVARTEILEANRTGDAAALGSLAGDFSALREAWQQTDHALGDTTNDASLDLTLRRTLADRLPVERMRAEC